MKSLRMLVSLALLLASAGCSSSWKSWAYEGSGRDEWQQPERVIEALGIEPGSRVGDLGAGSGYFTVRLARAVGPEGTVYAVDVDEDMNAYLSERLAGEGIDNVEVILGRYDDPLLPDGQIELLFTSNTYHHIESRPAYFRRLQQDLAPGGRVAILDYDGRKGLFVRLIGHYVEKQTIVDEMQEAGYRLEQDLDFLDRQSLLVFGVGRP